MNQKKQKLPKRIKNKWIKALRSGDYKQGGGFLLFSSNNGNRYCCLGVLGEICGNSEIEMSYRTTLNSGLHSNIPPILLGNTEENTLVKKLAAFNDNGKSFKWIASYIERYL